MDIASDLHLEFNKNFKLQNKSGSEILILAGDVTSELKNYRPVFEQFCNHWEHVIYVPGNHEYYDGEKSKEEIDDFLKKVIEPHFDNLHILINERIQIKDQWFVGTTLWSSPLKEDGFNDFAYIKQQNGLPITKYDYQCWNLNSIGFLKDNVQEGDVVITHHMPFFTSLLSKHYNFKSKYQSSEIDYHYFGNNSIIVDEIIKPLKPKLWVSGHTHESFDVMVDNTRCVCHPCGYPHEMNDYNAKHIHPSFFS